MRWIGSVGSRIDKGFPTTRSAKLGSGLYNHALSFVGVFGSRADRRLLFVGDEAGINWKVLATSSSRLVKASGFDHGLEFLYRRRIR